MRKASPQLTQDESEASGTSYPTCECKGRVLERNKSANAVNTQRIRMKSSLPADRENVLVIWVEAHSSRNIPLSRSLIQSKVLTLFTSVEAERSEEAIQEKFEACRGRLMRFERRSHLHNTQTQGVRGEV